jgi:hypothetical protein
MTAEQKTQKLCEICRKSEEKEYNPILKFRSSSFDSIEADPYGFHQFHVNCVIDSFRKMMRGLLNEREQLLFKISNLGQTLKVRENADRITDTLLQELDQKGNVSLTENLIIYCNERGNYFLKVTDYQKGYWAQIPLRPDQLRGVLGFFQRLANAKDASARSETQKQLEGGDSHEA